MGVGEGAGERLIRMLRGVRYVKHKWGLKGMRRGKGGFESRTCIAINQTYNKQSNQFLKNCKESLNYEIH